MTTEAKDDGGYAYPQSQHVGDIGLSEGGLSLRDYFAAHHPYTLADARLLARATNNEDLPLEDIISEMAWVYADAMIKARKK